MSLVINSSAIPITIAEITRTVEAEAPEDRPSDPVVQRAIQLLEEAHAQTSVYLAASEVEGFEGDLFIHWKTPKKRMTIISPRQPESALRLYKKLSTGWSQLIQNPSPADVTAGLAWVLE